MIEGGQVYHIRADHIGRPDFATNESGAFVWSATYTPFGGVHTSTGALSPNRFPGQWFQSESGLHQNWMRDYDPTTGRYLQADPLGLVDGASVYGYVRQSPMMLTDPRGEQSVGDVAEMIYCLLNPSSCGTDDFPNLDSPEPQMCEGCPPCRTKSGKTVLVGTKGYRYMPGSRAHFPYPDGEHVHMYEARQNPGNCKCFWHNLAEERDPPPPLGAININKDQNNGFE